MGSASSLSGILFSKALGLPGRVGIPQQGQSGGMPQGKAYASGLALTH